MPEPPALSLPVFELPALDVQANKYTRGKLTLIAGSTRYTGAAVLAACAAERMGAGYTEVATVREAMPVVRAASPSLVVCDRAQWQAQASYIALGSTHHPEAVCIGSGFVGARDKREENEEEAALVDQVLGFARCPVLIDGGALSYLAQLQAQHVLVSREKAGQSTVLTPHEGEARWLAEGFEISLHADDQAYNARLLAESLHAVVVLKGPDTFISDGTKVVAMTEGTPALAKAGTGDVLAGMIASLLAQGAPALQAAVAGATLHARAGVCAAQRFGMRGVVARDVVECIAPVMLAIEQTDDQAEDEADKETKNVTEDKEGML